MCVLCNQEWCDVTGEALEDGELSLQMTGRVMEFDVEGNMMVNYSEKLVTLLKDSRHLSELGMAVPDKIRKAAADAEKYYRYGIMLKKVRARTRCATALSAPRYARVTLCAADVNCVGFDARVVARWPTSTTPWGLRSFPRRSPCCWSRYSSSSLRFRSPPSAPEQTAR